MDLSTPGRQQPGEPSVAVAPAGRAVVAWWRRDATLAPRRDVVQIRRRASVTAPFIGPVTLSRRPGNLAGATDTAAAGALTLVGWTEAGGAIALRVTRGGAPPTVTRLAEPSPGDGIDVDIAPTGAALAVWARDGGAVRFATRSATTGTWSAPADLSAPGARDPRAAMAADGSSVVAWERSGAVEASAGEPGGTFAPAVTLTAPGEPGRLPGVAVDATGSAVATWYGTAVTIAERPAGGTFGAPRAISDPGGLPQVANLGAPEIALADGGRAVAAWRRGAGGGLRVEAAVRPAGADWGAAAVLSPAAARNAGRPALDLTDAGHAIVAWSQPVGVSLSAVRARALPRSAAAFGRLESVSTSNGRGTAPAVGLDATGRAVLAWREDPVDGPGRFFRAAIRFSPG